MIFQATVSTSRRYSPCFARTLENLTDHGTAIVWKPTDDWYRKLGRTNEGKYLEKLGYARGISRTWFYIQLMALVAALEDQVVDTTTVFDTQNGELTFYGKYK